MPPSLRAPSRPVAPADSATQAGADILDLQTLPGHLVRRLHQIAVALFVQELEAMALTPVQFAVLQAVANTPGLDQRRVARAAGLDTSTTASVVDRLEARGALQRQVAPEDRRVRLLRATPEGLALLGAAQPAMWRAQERILGPLAEDERAQFLRLLHTLVQAHHAVSRTAPEAGAAG